MLFDSHSLASFEVTSVILNLNLKSIPFNVALGFNIFRSICIPFSVSYHLSLSNDKLTPNVLVASSGSAVVHDLRAPLLNLLSLAFNKDKAFTGRSPELTFSANSNCILPLDICLAPTNNVWPGCRDSIDPLLRLFSIIFLSLMFILMF